MKLWSESWPSGERIPALYAAGRASAGGPVFSDDRNPHLAWSDAPAGTQSFALICHDFDVPSRMDDANRPDREIPEDLPRVDFFHWVLVDLPPTISSIAEGEFSRAFVAKGKPGPATLHGARHGLNDYTGFWSPRPMSTSSTPQGGLGPAWERPGARPEEAGHPDLAGRYFGYDGPFPPFNDSLIHHYVFTLYALAVPRAAVEGEFTGNEVRAAIYDHVLAEATLSGTYTLNPRLLR